jgi:hypothetical protein
MPFDRNSTAHHEAGHAVVALEYGHPVRKVVLHPEGHDPRGETVTLTISDLAAEPVRRRRSLGREAMVVTYAGFAGERRLLGIDVDSVGTYEADHVDALAQHFRLGPRGGHVGDERYHAWHRRVAKEADRLVLMHAAWIRRVTERLLLKGALTGAQVAELRQP